MTPQPGSRRAPGLMVLGGVLLIGCYAVARHYSLANIGADGDIGGGLLPLLGLVLIVVGAGMLLRRTLRH